MDYKGRIGAFGVQKGFNYALDTDKKAMCIDAKSIYNKPATI